MRLLISQKNQLFDLIIYSGFSYSQFTYNEPQPRKTNSATKSQVVEIKYNVVPDYGFTIVQSSYTLMVEYSPGQDKFIESKNCQNWEKVINYFESWLANLRCETDQVDLWSDMKEMLSNVIRREGKGDDKFTDQQYLLLTEKMTQLKKGITSLSLSNNEVDVINAKLDHILEQGKTLKRFDWQAQFVGTIITLIVALTITPDVGKQFFELVKSIFSNVLILPK